MRSFMLGSIAAPGGNLYSRTERVKSPSELDLGSVTGRASACD